MQKEQFLFQLHAYKQGKCDSHTEKLSEISSGLTFRLPSHCNNTGQESKFCLKRNSEGVLSKLHLLLNEI